MQVFKSTCERSFAGAFFIGAPCVFIATVNNDDDLRIKVAKEWSELNSVEITPEMINCAGCRIEGVKTPFCDSLCPIRQCALGRDVDSFSENTIKVTLPVINIGDNLQSDEKKYTIALI
ncbi:MAG: DUF3795 domain-containing protein [Parasporobacterium sp.]|nr:DUF3795 domain-containing protein [Parasporobacterium sp.]